MSKFDDSMMRAYMRLHEAFHESPPIVGMVTSIGNEHGLDLKVASVDLSKVNAGDYLFASWNLGARLKLPTNLHPQTKDLVVHFANALAEKLFMAQEKYGYQAEWAKPDWVKQHCVDALHEHMEKGDPRDVAAYCAFLWYHQKSTKREN